MNRKARAGSAGPTEVCLWAAGGVFVTRKGPGTTGCCRPPPLRTGPTRIPGTPKAREPASEAGSDPMSVAVACFTVRGTCSSSGRWTQHDMIQQRVSAPSRISRKWLRHMTGHHMTLIMVTADAFTVRGRKRVAQRLILGRLKLGARWLMHSIQSWRLAWHSSLYWPPGVTLLSKPLAKSQVTDF